MSSVYYIKSEYTSEEDFEVIFKFPSKRAANKFIKQDAVASKPGYIEWLRWKSPSKEAKKQLNYATSKNHINYFPLAVNKKY